MTHQPHQEILDRFAIAAEELLRCELCSGFVADRPTAVLANGYPLGEVGLDNLTQIARRNRIDVIYFEHAPANESQGPQRIRVFAERDGIAFPWTDCVLWAPEEGGPLLIMPQGTRVCFAYDGLTLTMLQDRPTQALDDGMARARDRLRRAAREVTGEALAAFARAEGRCAA